MEKTPPLTDLEKSLYEWQMNIPGFGEAGQAKLKASTVLISRLGGLGGLVALELAAAGVGRLVLAHGGKVKPSDLNRQLLQTRRNLGQPRMPGIVSRLKELNPDIDLIPIAENINPDNVEELVEKADIIVDAAPLFEERLLLNDATQRASKPMVECSMYGMTASVTTFLPGKCGCLRCYVETVPATWKRQFPVLGAVSGTAACLGAVEVVKWVTGLGSNLVGNLLYMDLLPMTFRKVALPWRTGCPACGGPP